MGTCLSKKKESSTSSSVSGDKSVSSSTRPLQSQTVTVSKPKVETEPEASLKKEKKQEDEGQVKREVFIIKHRKSHDGKNSKHPSSDGDASATTTNVAAEANGGVVVRTSSCTREEVDAILLQCGRLSRSSSGKAASSGERGRGRKYSGSKRSHDFDHCENDTANATGNTDLLCEDDNGVAGEDRHHLRQHRHHRRSPGPSSERRRRTPSRERDQNQRSSSRERRVSISPSRRSSDTTTGNPANSNNNNNNTTTTRPAKMVSVPPTVSSLAMDKSNNGGGGITRISVKRNVGAASPRSQSPARANGNAPNGKVLLVSENQQQQPSLSRNSSRKAEQSPYRRNPLSEIDFDSPAYPQSANNNSNKVQSRPKKETEPEAYQKTNVDTKDNTKSKTSSKKTMEQQEEEQIKGQSSMTENVVLKTTVLSSGLDNLKPQTLTRSRSSRRSRDLDHLLYPETQMNPAQSYTSLLLEDIQNFHQKNSNNNNNNNTPSIPLPPSVTRACAILEAVADLNSTTSSNLPSNHYAKRVPDSSAKEHPFVESEVVVIDDVMEPSLQKYVTVSRGGSLLGGVADMEDHESSGSNSFTVSGQKHLGFSSSCSWEPNSGDHSTDRWTSSRLNSSKRRECDFQGIGGGSFRGNEGVHAIPIVVTAATST